MLRAATWFPVWLQFYYPFFFILRHITALLRVSPVQMEFSVRWGCIGVYRTDSSTSKTRLAWGSGRWVSWAEITQALVGLRRPTVQAVVRMGSRTTTLYYHTIHHRLVVDSVGKRPPGRWFLSLPVSPVKRPPLCARLGQTQIGVSEFLRCERFLSLGLGIPQSRESQCATSYQWTVLACVDLQL